MADQGPEAIVFCGIQGSGKTSFYRERFFHTHVRLSLDLLGTRNREDVLLHACLATAQPFVIDNTSVSAKTRGRYLALARAAGFHCTLYYFHSSLEDALRRNAERPAPHRVPDLGVRGMLAKFDVPVGPEGFDKAFRVHLGSSGFVVEEMP